MIAHHQGGVALGKLAAEKGASSEVKQLGRGIREEQTAELRTLERLVQQTKAQPGMGRPIEQRDMADMAKLEAASGRAFDKLWLDVISAHHSAAIQMAQIEAAGGKLPAATDLSESIISSQSEELTRFNALVESMG